MPRRQRKSIPEGRACVRCGKRWANRPGKRCQGCWLRTAGSDERDAWRQTKVPRACVVARPVLPALERVIDGVVYDVVFDGSVRQPSAVLR